MKTVILILACFFLLSLTTDYTNNDKVIVWIPERKLTPNDFLGPVLPVDPSEMAATKVTIKCKPELVNGKVVFTTQALFSKEASWFKPEAKSHINILIHEQLHFDIAELYARYLRKYLATDKNYKTNTPEDADKMMVYIENNFKAMESENIRYDIESDHSRNKEKQHQWELDVAKRMKELEAYK
jgi:hypothetical protein